jgi:serine/threonine protein kinase
MGTTPLCPSCGKPLAASAPKGLCQECLLKAGFPTGTESGGKGPPFNPATVRELAEKFPQLEIIELIGSGGMGAVYKARQKELDRIVALKILPPGIGDDAAFADRFAREARALARLNHSNIITLYEFGRADGLFFFLMEFVDGVNLRQFLNARRLSAREALAIVPQICDALQYAHDQGIVHRDIKPENILLDRKGRVKVADFGLARLRVLESEGSTPGSGEAISAPSTLTETGKVMGTPDYMAPEQAEKPTEVDHRADIYSLGVVFYQMLTGELPGRRIEPPSRKVHLDVRLDDVVLRALEREPERRYQQASQVKTDVETITQTPGTGRSESVRHSSGAWKVAAVIVAGVFVLLAIPVGAVLLYLSIPNVVKVPNPSKARIQPPPTTVQQLGNAVGTGVGKPFSFGPVITRIIQSSETGTDRFLDLDTGQLLTPPREIGALFDEPYVKRVSWELHFDPRALKMREWLRSSGANLMIGDGGLERLEMREGMAIAPRVISNDVVVPFGFDQADPNYLATRIKAMLEPPSVIPILQLQPGFDPRLNTRWDSFCFRTREGSVGILQILNPEDNPRGVRIRYKLLQPGSELSGNPSKEEE